MHRSETYDLTPCLDCGGETAPGPDRAYPLGPEAVLCFECAVRRGGRYDARRDVWTASPSLDGLTVPAAAEP